MRKNAYGGSSRQTTAGNPPAQGADAQVSSLWEFLTAWKCDGGETRLTGSITIFCEDGSLKVCFNDRDSSSLAFRTLPDLSSAFKVCSELLKDGRLDWRHARQGASKR